MDDLQNTTPTPEVIWQTLRDEAEAVALKEPLAATMVYSRVLEHTHFAESLAQILALQLGDQNLNPLQLQSLILGVYEKYPEVVETFTADLYAVFDRDAACNCYIEPFLFSKGFHALQTYRIAHQLWQEGREFIAQMFQSASNRVFAVDIHPAARLGKGIMIDHATAVIIGETAVVGNDVSILHGVTLGGTGKETGDRHPKIGNGVLLAAHAQLLGNIKIGDCSKIGANAVVLSDVPARTTYAGVPARKVGVPDSERPSRDMKMDFGSVYQSEDE